MTSRKISAAKLSDFRGKPRSKRPRLNHDKKVRKELLERERVLIETLMRDDSIRDAFRRGAGRSNTPMSVWSDSDGSWGKTELGPNHLPRWEELTEYMKLFIGYDAGMRFSSSVSFTVHIHPDLTQAWDGSSLGFMRNAEQRLRRSLASQELKGIPICYVAEVSGKTGRTRVNPHLHGYALCEHQSETGRLEEALRSAFYREGRIGTRPAVKVEPSYDFADEEFHGRVKWINYFTKNVERWDQLLGKRRVYISRPLLKIARDAWGIRRED